MKLGQKFDLKYATTTNKLRESFTTKGEFVQVDLPSYGFKPRVPLPHFTDYSVEVTPRSNLVYSITTSGMDFESFSTANDEREKLLAVLQQKYGKATVMLSSDAQSVGTRLSGARER